MPVMTHDRIAGGVQRPSRHVCVYCGSGRGTTPIYMEAARALGRNLAESGLGLVYGGGDLGLMGAVANASIEAGGYVTGIMPRFLAERENMKVEGLRLLIVDNMHQRKMEMFEMADAFVALPGGIGTLEELVEQLTWSQLGQHEKPIVVANIGGFWDPFLSLIAHMRSETFVRPGFEVHCHVVAGIDDIVPTIEVAWRERLREPRDTLVIKQF